MMIWLNGALAPQTEARIDPSDRGFTLGDGLFETIRVRDASPVWLALHLQRLRDGAAMLDIPVAWADQTIAQAIHDLTQACELRDAAARVTLTRGPGARGVSPPAQATPTLMISLGPLPTPAAPAHVIVSSLTRRNAASPLSRIKSLNYLDNILARQEAERRGFDDAILLNANGMIAEATAANFFLLIDGAVATPPVTDGALPGIARGRLLAAGLAFERSLQPADLDRATAAFLTNSLGFRTLAQIEDRSFPTDHPFLERVRIWCGDEPL